MRHLQGDGIFAAGRCFGRHSKEDGAPSTGTLRMQQRICPARYAREFELPLTTVASQTAPAASLELPQA